jgi:hypothetical protein
MRLWNLPFYCERARGSRGRGSGSRTLPREYADWQALRALVAESASRSRGAAVVSSCAVRYRCIAGVHQV